MNLDSEQYLKIFTNIPNTALILFSDNLDILRIMDGSGVLDEVLPGIRAHSSLNELNYIGWKTRLQDLCRTVFNENQRDHQVSYKDGETEFRTLSVHAATGERIGILLVQAKNLQRRRERDKLREEKEAAQETSQIKSTFMARISHEIRTPLNAIIGFVEQLQKTRLSDKQRNYLKIIDKSSTYLLDLVNEILTFSKLDSGEQKLDLVDFNCEALFNEIYNTFKNRADEKKINLRYLFDHQLNLILQGDVVRLKQIVINLVSNALKFTEYGYVELRVEQIREEEDRIWIRIMVSDTGIGISENKLGEIFKEYKQASAGITRKHGGTGLGLTISKRLTELMSGTISVNSKDGEGSVFSVEIPLQKSQLSFLTKDTLQINTELLSGRSALIVDDDAMNRMLGEIILEGFNMDVSLASDGSEAIRILENNAFEVILLDIHMPVVSGLDVADFLRKSGKHRKVKIIAVTADMIREELDNYRRHGIDDFLIKPFREISLFNKLCQVMDVDMEQIKQESFKIVLKEEDMSKPYDLGELRSVTRGNEAFFDEMIQTFIENASEGIQQIRRAFDQGEWAFMRETAHRLIPSFKHLAVKKVVSDLVELKNEPLQSPDQDRLKQLIDRMEEVTSEVVHHLKQEKYTEQ